MKTTTTQNLTAGQIALHYRPSTGRIIRTVEIITINGEAATVRSLNGKNKGAEYLVALNALHPADEATS